MKNSINIEKLLKEAKIIYWKENDITLYQQNTIGILDTFKNSVQQNLDNNVELSKEVDKKCVEVS